MRPLPEIGLLGAEKQAAVSAAVAWPEREFIFVSDQRVIDGWDLPNVRIVHGRPDQPSDWTGASVGDWVPLCPRWLHYGQPLPTNRPGTFRLESVLGDLATRFAEAVLPIQRQPWPGSPVIVKGDVRHRPDGLLISTCFPAGEPDDPHACGVLFQPWLKGARSYLATGRRWQEGTELAVVAVHSEACAREDMLQAGEVVCHDTISDLSLAMLDYLEHRGFFTLNWVEHEGRAWLTSYRPVPRGLFGTLRRAGLELFGPRPAGVHRARPGVKFTIDIHYSSYQALSA